MIQLKLIKHITDFWEKRANKVLSHFKYKHPDEIDMYDICYNYGIDIMPLESDFYDGEINNDAFSYPKGIGKSARGVIYINPHLDPIDKKILLAEEFCHLHSHIINQFTDDLYQVNRSEQQAKKMSAYLLMPHRFLMKLFEDEYYDHAVLVTDIADYFLVTEEFAHFRLELLFKQRVDMVTNNGGVIGTLTLFNE